MTVVQRSESSPELLLVFVSREARIAYVAAGLVCFVLIVTIPFGVASLRIAFFGVWPFGRAVVRQQRRTGSARATRLGSRPCAGPTALRRA